MGRWESQITIKASVEKVFDYVADIARHPEWASNPLEVRKTSAGPPGVGATFSSTGKFMGTHKDEVTIAEYSPPTRLVFESRGDAGHMRHWFALREQGGSTMLTKGTESVKPSFLSRLAAPLIARAVPKGLRKDLDKIKANVEGSAG